MGKLPILLSIGFVTTLVALTIARASSWAPEARGVGGTWLVAYLAWLVIESRVAMKELDKGTTRLDRGTLELYAAGRFLTVTAALALASPPVLSARALVGALVFVSGVVFRIVAIRTLGVFYSHRVRVVDEHRIIDRGPYRLVRHPAYLGMLVAHAGVLVLFPHWAAGLAFALVFVPGVVFRIVVEERALADVDGYRAYAERHARLVPFVW